MKYFFFGVLIHFSFISQGVIAKSCDNNLLYKKLASLKQGCRGKKVHLTFDDGPDSENTPRILKALNQRGVKSTFYVSTHNLKPNTLNPTLVNMIHSGHIVASHGHHHHAHDLRLVKKNGSYQCDPNILSEAESAQEIVLSSLLLSQATNGLYQKQKNKLFRFPYGRGAIPSSLELEYIAKNVGGSDVCDSSEKFEKAKDYSWYKEELKNYRTYGSEALKRLHSRSFDHVGWNFDSKDSHSAVVEKASRDIHWYTEDIVSRLCQNPSQDIMALFHDKGKEFNAKAIGAIIDTARCLGANFVSHDELIADKNFVANSGVIQQAPNNRPHEIEAVAGILDKASDYGSPALAKCPDSISKFELSKSCWSEYTHTEYALCEGASSICIDGKWFKRDDKVVKEICPQI